LPVKTFFFGIRLSRVCLLYVIEMMIGVNSFLGDSAISDMFGLGLPRGSLMGNQSTIGSSSYHNYQYSSYDQTQGSSSQQHEVMLCTGVYAWAYIYFNVRVWNS